jgi:hypothetical protein
MKHAGLNLFKSLCAIMIFSLIGENSSAKDNSKSEGLLRYVDLFRDCIIDGNHKAADGKVKLGRPWQNSHKAVYINSNGRRGFGNEL